MEDSSSSSSEETASSSLSGGMPESGNGTGLLNQGRHPKCCAGSKPATSANLWKVPTKLSNLSRKQGRSKKPVGQYLYFPPITSYVREAQGNDLQNRTTVGSNPTTKSK